MEINENLWKPMEINENQWKSMKIHDLELEQAATTASQGRESVAWGPNTIPNKPTVSQEHARPVQRAGGRLECLQAFHRLQDKKNTP